MTQLTTILDSQGGQQMTIDEYLALDSDTCPYVAKCETRRAGLAVYRPGHACHWIAFKDVANCPIFRQNGGNDK